MSEKHEAVEIASALMVGVGAVARRIRQVRVPGEPTMPERTALARLDRGGPATSAALARMEQITPQAMGVTLSGLQARGLIERRADPNDGRSVVLALTEEGLRVLNEKRGIRVELIADALAREFSDTEVAQLAAAAPLLERIARAL
ncbi:MarR family winged helix-turn-helix transcriptional regulator [Nocardia callitridis]|uniref:MarR family transcriptional regulator n=1 Tax=Nocardia callitridis TaxID=648753 RepID=A0ABP9KCW6_9NOCA